MTSYHYATPPKGYTPFYGDSTSPTSPYNPEYVYYAPQQHYPAPTSYANVKHSRTKSFNQTSAAQPGGWHSPAGYPSQQFYGPNYAVPPQKTAYVSTATGAKTKLRSFSMSGGNHQYAPTRSQKQHVYVDVADDAHDRRQSHHYESQTRSRRRSHVTDKHVFVNQDDQYTHESPKRSRARRASNANATVSPQKSAKTTHAPSKATEEDAIAAGIPAGYSIKNWDPEEHPLILLGSVFDANSLGKWIYDWTIFRHGAPTPMADMAGDLWLLMIKLAGKMKRAEDCYKRVRGVETKELIEDFLTGGDRLWDKFKDLLKTCEQYMWRAARRQGSKGISMSKNAGTEFVDTLLGRDRELQRTEDLMSGFRLWNMRFDSNLEDILRRPSLA